MASEEKLCECCGKLSDNTVRALDWAKEYKGEIVCGDCLDLSCSDVISRIRARRSAPQPPKSAEGREIRVGDRVYCPKHAGGELVLTVSELRNSKCFDAKDDNGETYPWRTGRYWRHVADPAQPPQDGQAVMMGPDGRYVNVPAQPPGAENNRLPKGEISPEVIERHGSQGPGVLTEHGASVPTTRDGGAGACPPVAPPSLAAFTDAVEKHLLPRLPNGFKAVADISNGGYGRQLSGPIVVLWVFDDSGAELYREHQPWPCWFGREEALGISRTVADALLSRSARHQPEPPRTEPSWLDGYLARPASERSGR